MRRGTSIARWWSRIRIHARSLRARSRTDGAMRRSFRHPCSPVRIGGRRRADAKRAELLPVPPQAIAGSQPRSPVAARHDPAIPAAGPAPAEADERAVTAPLPAGPCPSVGVPAIWLVAIDELYRHA